MATLTIDGLPISLADEAAVRAVIAKKDAAIAAAETALADAKTALTTEQGKTAALESQLAEAKDAATPAALDKLVADRAALIGKVKAVAPNITTDGKTDAEIRRAAVAAKLGDAAKDMDDAAIAGAFAVLSATDAKPVTIHNIAPATPVADAAATVATLRTARYA